MVVSMHKFSGYVVIFTREQEAAHVPVTIHFGSDDTQITDLERY